MRTFLTDIIHISTSASSHIPPSPACQPPASSLQLQTSSSRPPASGFQPQASSFRLSVAILLLQASSLRPPTLYYIILCLQPQVSSSRPPASGFQPSGPSSLAPGLQPQASSSKLPAPCHQSLALAPGPNPHAQTLEPRLLNLASKPWTPTFYLQLMKPN